MLLNFFSFLFIYVLFAAPLASVFDKRVHPRIVASIGGFLAGLGFIGRAFLPSNKLWQLFTCLSLSGKVTYENGNIADVLTTVNVLQASKLLSVVRSIGFHKPYNLQDRTICKPVAKASPPAGKNFTPSKIKICHCLKSKHLCISPPERFFAHRSHLAPHYLVFLRA